MHNTMLSVFFETTLLSTFVLQTYFLYKDWYLEARQMEMERWRVRRAPLLDTPRQARPAARNANRVSQTCPNRISERHWDLRWPATVLTKIISLLKTFAAIGSNGDPRICKSHPLAAAPEEQVRPQG